MNCDADDPEVPYESVWRSSHSHDHKSVQAQSAFVD